MTELRKLIGKRIVGAQNFIPLLRDAVDLVGRGATVHVTIDTDIGRYTGKLKKSSSTHGAYVLTDGNKSPFVEYRKVLAARIDVIED